MTFLAKLPLLDIDVVSYMEAKIVYCKNQKFAEIEHGIKAYSDSVWLCRIQSLYSDAIITHSLSYMFLAMMTDRRSGA